MSWSSRRQTYISLTVGFIILCVAAGGYGVFFYKAPNCFDGVMNGAETGIDCGGACQKICSAEAVAPLVLWARALPVTQSVYNAVAMVKNQNVNASAQSISYSFSLYDDKNLLIAERTGTTFLEPGATAAIFEPSIIVGGRPPTRTFFKFTSEPDWQRTSEAPRILISGETLLDVSSSPRVTALAQNSGFTDIPEATLIAILYDESDNAIAVSKTVVASLAAQKTASVAFTWPSPFTAPVARIEIIPRVAPETTPQP